jgi:hypothetical protein
MHLQGVASMAAIVDLDLDLAVYQDYCRGARKVDLAQKYGRDRDTITAMIARARAAMPPRERVDVFDQSLEILDQGLATFAPMMLDGDKAAARIVDRYLGRRNEMLGLDSPAKLELYQAQHDTPPERVDVRAELAALVQRIRGEQQP